MKSVLISIQPQWCELIASGKKTIEVRKTRPKIETPFKCYIYQTKRKAGLKHFDQDSNKLNDFLILRKCGKVIGEFVCDDVITDFRGEHSDDFAKYALLSLDEQKKYGGNKPLYGWHITEPKLFDEPRELGEFYTICNKYGDDSCGDCPYLAVEQCSFPCDDCVDTWCSVDNIKPITRPPQSWCYVDELQ